MRCCSSSTDALTPRERFSLFAILFPAFVVKLLEEFRQSGISSRLHVDACRSVTLFH
jgi:hypothetical protein